MLYKYEHTEISLVLAVTSSLHIGMCKGLLQFNAMDTLTILM